MFRCRLFALLLLSASLCDAGTMLYMGTWPKMIYGIDESTYQVVRKIELKTDVPRNVILTPDRSKLIVTTIRYGGIETIDLAKGEVIDSFELGDHNSRVSLAGVAVDPTGNFLYSNITISHKLIDRWEVGSPKMSVIDLKQHKVIRDLEIPAADRAASGGYRGGNFRISPDGKFLYQFAKTVMIYDTATLKKVQTIELSKPMFPGMESVTFSPEIDPNDDGNTVTGVFNTSDAEVHREVFGIASFQLNERKFEFTPVAPAVQGMAGIRFTPDRKKAYTVAITGTHGDRHCEFWAIDTSSHKLLQRGEFACRPRFNFGLSSAGDSLLIYGAGFELEVYNAATMKLQKTLAMDGDIETPLVTVIPKSDARASR